MNNTIIWEMVLAVVSVSGFLGMTIFWRAAFACRERARRSHVMALEAKALADNYRSTGKVMFQQALESYEEGQQFWQSGTVALLDAKRREAKVDQFLNDAEAFKKLEVVRKEAV